MAKDRSKEVNRVSFSIWAPSDPGSGAQNFNLIDLSGYRGNALKITSIEWGAIIQNATDRTNFLSHYCALLRNASINDDAGMSTTAPIQSGGTKFSDIIWMQSINSLQGYGQTKKDFSEPLIVGGNENVILYLPSPNLSAGITAAIYTFLFIRADVIESAEQARLGGFKLR